MAGECYGPGKSSLPRKRLRLASRMQKKPSDFLQSAKPRHCSKDLTPGWLNNFHRSDKPLLFLETGW
jgi:hypothetical protein